MKAVLGLPGRNPETEAWLRKLLRTLALPDAEVASYGHWQGGVEPDVAGEASRHPVAGRGLVVAKSMGTMVLLAGIEAGDPERAVLIGTPLQGYDEAQIDALKALAARRPCLFIQQTDDFTGDFAALHALLGDAATVVEVPGSDHVYADVDQLAMLIGRWQESLDG